MPNRRLLNEYMNGMIHALMPTQRQRERPAGTDQERELALVGWGQQAGGQGPWPWSPGFQLLPVGLWPLLPQCPHLSNGKNGSHLSEGEDGRM